MEEVAKARRVRLTALPDVLVASQQADGGVAVEVELGAIVRTKPRKVPQRRLGVFSIIEMCSVWRTFLGSRRNQMCGYIHTSRRSQDSSSWSKRKKLKIRQSTISHF